MREFIGLEYLCIEQSAEQEHGERGETRRKKLQALLTETRDGSGDAVSQEKEPNSPTASQYLVDY